VALAVRQLSQYPVEFSNWPKSKLTVVSIVFVLLFSGLIWAFGFGESLSRWMELNSSGTLSSRLLVDQSIARYALPASSWWGFGPGTFQITFPFFTHALGDRAAGIWQNAHQDYLQVLMEWGYVGGALWAVLFFGGVGLTFSRHLKRQRSWDRESRLFSLACLLSMGGLLLHALVDFPLQIPSLQLYAAVILGFLWNFSDSPRRKRISRDRSSQHQTEAIQERVPAAHHQIFSQRTLTRIISYD
jgi:hypothetical protein